MIHPRLPIGQSGPTWLDNAEAYMRAAFDSHAYEDWFEMFPADRVHRYLDEHHILGTDREHHIDVLRRVDRLGAAQVFDDSKLAKLGGLESVVGALRRVRGLL